MPPVGRDWTDAQFKALADYVKQHIYKVQTSGG